MMHGPINIRFSDIVGVIVDFSQITFIRPSNLLIMQWLLHMIKCMIFSLPQSNMRAYIFTEMLKKKKCGFSISDDS